jgi:hypothetical protein
MKIDFPLPVSSASFSGFAFLQLDCHALHHLNSTRLFHVVTWYDDCFYKRTATFFSFRV